MSKGERRSGGFGKAVLGVAGAAIVALFFGPALWNNVCERLPIGFIGCSPEYQRIRNAEAVVLLDRFYGRASGADPDRAYELLGTPAREVLSKEDFRKRWLPVEWAELLDGASRTEEFNSFEFKFREYHENGMVTTRRVVQRLGRTSTGLRILTTSEGTRAELEKVKFPRVRLTRLSSTYMRPYLRADVALFKTELKVGGNLLVLCKLDAGKRLTTDLSTPGDAGWWYRTPQGWIPSSEMAPMASMLAVPACDRRMQEVYYL